MQASIWDDVRTLTKRALMLEPVNWAVVKVVRQLPKERWVGRVPVAVAEVCCHVGAPRLDFVMTNPARCNIAKGLFWGNGQLMARKERFALELFCVLAPQAELVLDVGANTGLFSLVSARANPSAKVHAFEIMPEAFETLFRNVVRNDLLTQISCRSFGIGAEGGIVMMPMGSVSSSIPTSLSTDYDFADGVRVAMRALDAISPTFGVAQDAHTLMKIDVEATERDVFEGARDFFRARSLDVVCEVLPNTNGADAIQDVLDTNGYNKFMITEDALVPFDRVTPSSEYHDWLFTRRGPKDVASLAERVNSVLDVNDRRR